MSFIGRLATDPETRSGERHHVTSFRLAVLRRRRLDGADRGAVFVEVVSFDALADNVAEHLEKGRQVAVSGRFEQREWVAEDGAKRSRLQVVAEGMTFLARVNNGDGV